MAQKKFSRYGIDIATSSLELICELEDYPNMKRLPNAKHIYNNGVFIPCFPGLKENDIKRIKIALENIKDI